MKKITFFALLLISINTHAVIYMQTDENGHAVYSDTPQDNSQPVLLNKVNAVPAINNPQNVTEAENTSDTASPKAQNQQPYNSFSIDTPKDNESIQNQSTVTAKIAVSPELQPGDTIQLYMDGQPIGQPTTNPEISLENITRGTHVIFAKLLDKSHQVLKQTNSITINVHRVNTNFRPGS